MSSRGSAAEVGTDDLPVYADLGGRSSGKFAAEIQHGDAVADVEDQVRVMLDKQDAAAKANATRAPGSFRARYVSAPMRRLLKSPCRICLPGSSVTLKPLAPAVPQMRVQLPPRH